MRVGLVAVVVAGLAGVLGLATALALPGDLDPGFGNGGLLVSDVSQATDDRAHDVIVQPDGRILAIGFGQGRPEELVAARYHPDGAFDPTFGDDGKVAWDVVALGQWVITGSALQPDGKIVAAGSTNFGDVAVVRLLDDGTLDPTFDGDGVTRTGFGSPLGFDSATSVAVQPDGRIVVVGRASLGFFDPWATGFAVLRLDASGTLDPTFDGDGRLITRVGPNATASDVAVHPDGRIVVVGSAGFSSWERHFAVAIYDGIGTQTGGAIVDLGGFDEARAVAVAPNGGIIAVGRSDDDFGIARLLETGAVDSGFGGGDGHVVTPIASGVAALALDVVVQPNGKIVAAGATTTAGAQDFALARYTTDGLLDSSFGGDGIVTTDIGGGTFERLGGAALAPDGDIVAAGWTGTGCGPFVCAFDFGLARYEGDQPDLPVRIDVKPGSDLNPVQPDRGTIPVAIISTEVFDATTVDASSVCFGDAEAPNERDCTEEHGRGHVEDVNADGRADLLLHFAAPETGIDAGDTSACLTGRTGDIGVRGCDAILTV